MDAIMPNWTAIPQLLIFLAALIVVKYFILDPTARILKARNDKIEGAELDAGRLQEQSRELDEVCKQKIAEARAGAKRDRLVQRVKALAEEKDILEHGRAEAQKKLRAIAEGIREESDMARQVLRSDAEWLSRRLAEKLLGRQLS